MAEKMDYYKLMVIRVSDGEAAFNSELQNNPIDPDNAAFNPGMVLIFDEGIDGLEGQPLYLR
ncbi:MAG: hypothetical protein ACLRZZ_14430 [Enterocloster sp.]